MWQRLPSFIREWPILIVGILLIVPLLYFSSFEASPSKSTEGTSSLNRSGEFRQPVSGHCDPGSKRGAKFTAGASENCAEFRASPRQSTRYVA